MSKIRVAVCEDIDSIRKHFVDLISSRNDMEIVGVARNGEEIK